MSIARKCDRCGTYHDGTIFSVDLSGRWTAEYGEYSYDLCRDCVNEFDEFMKGAKPKNLLERLIEKKKE